MDELNTQRWYRECNGKNPDQLLGDLQELERQNLLNPGGNPILGAHIGFVRRMLREKFQIDK